jgi:glycosyltransferase involved in cell wall biosynthesis
MNILVNTRLLLPAKMEGIGLFTHELMKRVVKYHPEHTFYFLFDRPFDKHFIYAQNVKPIVYGPPARHPFLYILWFELTIPKVIKKYHIDIFFSPDHFLSLRAKVPTLLAVHDINFMRHSEYLPILTAWYYRFFFPKFVKKAAHLVAVSNYTKNDVSSYFKISGDKIDIVYNASNMPEGELLNTEIQQTRNNYSGGKPYFFYIGSLHPRKNIGRMMLAFDKFIDETHADVKLIIGGKAMWGNKQMEKEYQQIKHKENVIFTGRLDEKEAKLLMGSAWTLLFVSLYEGFGVPILEAMGSGVPVITSNKTSMPEVGGDAACYVNPLSVEDISSAIKRLYTDNDYRKELINKGFLRNKDFSWDKSAEALWQAILKVKSNP